MAKINSTQAVKDMMKKMGYELDKNNNSWDKTKLAETPTTPKVKWVDLEEVKSPLTKENIVFLENTAKHNNCIIKEGLRKSEHVLEVIVEKYNTTAKVVYKENEKSKPFFIKEKRFNSFDEALKSIHLPFNDKVNKLYAQALDEANSNFVSTEKQIRENAYKTDNLSKNEANRRQLRGLVLFEKIMNDEQKRRGLLYR